MALKNLLVRIGADASGFTKGLNKADKDLKRFKSSTSSAVSEMTSALGTNGLGGKTLALAGLVPQLGAVTAAVAAVGGALAALGLGLAKGSEMAMKYEASIGQLNRNLGSSAKAFQQWGEAQGAALGLGRADLASYGATYSGLLSIASKNTQELLTDTENMIRATAVVAAGTGRSMSDVFERIRSGILGETDAIEDLGIYVSVAMLESTNAFKQLANGKHWEQLSFQVQNQIRNTAILEQAFAKYGNTVQNNAIYRQNILLAQLQNMRLSLSQAFLPIYNAILPALTSMATALANVTNTIAQFVNALFGTTSSTNAGTAAIQQQAAAVNSVGDAYDNVGKAAKKAKGNVASFDQVNQLSLPDNSGAGAAGAAAGAGAAGAAAKAGAGSATTLQIPQWIKDLVATVKENFAPVSDAFARLKKAFGELGRALSDLWNTIGSTDLVKWLGKLAAFQWAAVIDRFTGLIEVITGVTDVITGIVNLDPQTILKGVREIASGLYDALVVGGIGALIPGSREKLIELKTTLAEAWNDALATALQFWGWIKDGVVRIWDALVTGDWAGVGTVLQEKWNDIQTFTETIWGQISGVVGKWWGTITAIYWDRPKEALQTSFNNIALYAETKWAAIKKTVSDWWEKIKALAWDAPMNAINQVWDDTKTWAVTKWTAIKKTVSEWVDKIAGLNFSSIGNAVTAVWTDLKTGTSSAWEGLKTIVKNSINWIIDQINNFIDRVNSIKINIPVVSIPGTNITLGGGSIGFPQLPKIPKLAGGGLVDSPTIAEIGEAGTEAVVPLERTSFVDKLAGALGNAVKTAMESNAVGTPGTGVGSVVIDGVELARVFAPYSVSEQQRIGPRMVTAY